MWGAPKRPDQQVMIEQQIWSYCKSIENARRVKGTREIMMKNTKRRSGGGGVLNKPEFKKKKRIKTEYQIAENDIGILQ